LYLFLILGIALLAFGLFWFIGGLQGGYFGAGLQLYGGLLATIIGFVLVMIVLYERVKQKSAA
jgi:hypothetical protein